MVLVFDDFELDTDRFELRCAGTVRAIEPQVFDVLAYLVANRDRVVSKGMYPERDRVPRRRPQRRTWSGT